jgi:hypothetical protein
MDGDAARRHIRGQLPRLGLFPAADEHAPAQITALLEDGTPGMALLAWSLSNPSDSRDIIEPVLAHFDALPGPVPGADRIAWLAIQPRRHGEGRQVWEEKAGDASPLAAWVRAKLLMREGRMTEAAAILEQVLALLERGPAEGASSPPEWIQNQNNDLAQYPPFDVAQRVREEWSVLWALKQGKTPEESDKALQYLDGYDQSYVAEVAMTTEELLAHVFQDPPRAGTAGRGQAETERRDFAAPPGARGRLEDGSAAVLDSDAPAVGALREGRNPAPEAERAER